MLVCKQLEIKDLLVETHGRASRESPLPSRRNGDITIICLKKLFEFSHYGINIHVVSKKIALCAKDTGLFLLFYAVNHLGIWYKR